MEFLETYLNRKFGLKPKHSSNEELEQWRKQIRVVRNRKRRFRYTANITKRDEAASMRSINQKKLQIANLISNSGIQFYSDVSPRASRLLKCAISGSNVEDHNGSDHLHGTNKKRALTLLFLLLELISFVLDTFGKSQRGFLLVAFLLSAFGFCITFRTCISERTTAATRLQAERQLGVLEIVFALLQLFSTLIYLILPVFGVKNSYNVSTLPLAFAVIAVAFGFLKDENVNDLSRHLNFISLSASLLNTSFPLTNSVPASSSDDLGQIEIIVDNFNSHIAPVNRQINQRNGLQNRDEVRRPLAAGVQSSMINLTMFNCFEDLYSNMREKFNLQGDHWENRRKWLLVYVDDDNDIYLLLIGEQVLIGDQERY